ncbi:hypothetical protein [Grimontia sp. NTOU-MAR1]|uniref:hypothetical protein n=1 Tax=Grimontia sp. NTOU-MAR1 TaxID=3111011 RepID=UPI002DB7E3C1|nr:hypothetical protein [Grimontia sp. NTOU-MAR1]WRV99286.1 hypothetical protein VP504_07780 [Grimontia sp. NTOU-MAR1]
MPKSVKPVTRNLWVLLILMLTALSPAKAETLTAAQAYEKGKILHFQDKFEEAEPYLLQAGQGGYAAAYYLIAGAEPINRFMMSEREYKYLTLAAKEGHLLAMLVLTRDRSLAPSSEKSSWRQSLKQILAPHVEKKNPFAMALKARMHSNDQDTYDAYTTKAAEAGYPTSQYYLATRYRNGRGWFLLPGSREKEVAKLFEAAARGGYHEAIMYKGFTTISGGDIDTGMAVLTSLVDKGDAQVLSGLGIRLSGIGKEYIKSWTYFDKVKGTVLLKSLALSTSPKFDDAYQNFSDRAWATLTDEEKAQVDKLTEEYLNNHTVYKQDGLDEYEYTVDNLHTALERWGGNAIE